MVHVDVRIHFHGSPVEDRLIQVRDTVHLGETSDAVVAFPGASLLVRRDGEHVVVRGRRLGVGDGLTMTLGAVKVALEVVQPDPIPSRATWVPDLRLLVATASVALAGAAWDSVVGVVQDNPVAARAVEDLLQPFADDPSPRTAAVQVAEQALESEELPVGSEDRGPQDPERPPATYLPFPPEPPACDLSLD